MQEEYRALRGRCFSCGFLAKWSQGQQGWGCFEADWTARIDGKAYSHPLILQGEIITIPFCFQRAVNFEDAGEVGQLGGRSLEEFEQSTAEVFKRDRQCPKWYPYRPGLDPKAHLEELRMLEVEQRREAFELKMEQDRRHFELELANRLERSEERRHSMMGWVAKIGVVLIAIEILAVILGASPGSLLGDWLSR